MKNPAHDIAKILVEDDLGYLGDDLFVSIDIPAKPDHLVYLTVTGSAQPDDARHSFSYSIVQVVVRGDIGGYLECSNRMYDLHNHLHGIVNRTVDDTRYVFIYNVSGPVDLGIDDTMRPSMAATYRVMRHDYIDKE